MTTSKPLWTQNQKTTQLKKKLNSVSHVTRFQKQNSEKKTNFFTHPQKNKNSEKNKPRQTHNQLESEDQKKKVYFLVIIVSRHWGRVEEREKKIPVWKQLVKMKIERQK